MKMLIKRVPQAGAIAGLLTAMALVASAQAQSLSSPADRDAAARAAYARGDNTRASASLNEAVRLNPFDPVALNNLAVNYAAQGDYQNAIALLERAQRLAPNRPDIVNNLANLKAWMAQDSQFAVGSRGAPQALNFPRAEDSPPEFPPLWGTPAGATVQQPMQQQQTPVRNTAQVPVYAAPQAYPQPVYQQQPAYQQPTYQQPSYPAQAAYPTVAPSAQPYVQPSTPITQASAYSSRPAALQTRQVVITERASDAPRHKKKKIQALDCPVP